MSEYVVPMYESERGWGAKVDGYAGPFPSMERAMAFKVAHNRKNNSEEIVPDYYIAALEPRERNGDECVYRTDVDGVDYAAEEPPMTDTPASQSDTHDSGMVGHVARALYETAQAENGNLSALPWNIVKDGETAQRWRNYATAALEAAGIEELRKENETLREALADMVREHGGSCLKARAALSRE